MVLRITAVISLYVPNLQTIGLSILRGIIRCSVDYGRRIRLLRPSLVPLELKTVACNHNKFVEVKSVDQYELCLCMYFIGAYQVCSTQ
jgi:hypothetical protein